MSVTTIVGPCKNHPDRPGSTVLADGTLRCDPCVQESRVVGWDVAKQDHPCPYCGSPIGYGDQLAVLDTVPPTLVCEAEIEWGVS